MQKWAKPQVTAHSMLLQERRHSSNNVLSIGIWYPNYTVLDFTHAAGGKNALQETFILPKGLQWCSQQDPKALLFPALELWQTWG